MFWHKPSGPHDRGMQDPVRGRALVVAVNGTLDPSPHKHGATKRLEATLVVQAEGVPDTTVQHSEQVNNLSMFQFDRWPTQGGTVPVTVDRADPSHLRIEWQQMPCRRERLRQIEAEQARTLLAEVYGNQPSHSQHYPRLP
jgi:hypothetical protein